MSATDEFRRQARMTWSAGPFVMARAALEPQGRWDEFLTAFGDLVHRFNTADDGAARIRSDYFVISVER